MRSDKPARTVRRAKRLRQQMSLPEVLLWRELKRGGLNFRKQHEAGDYVLDFFCARANLCVEVDGFAHNAGDRPEADAKRDAWLAAHRIDTVRISARDVLRDPAAVAARASRRNPEPRPARAELVEAPATTVAPAPFDKLRVSGALVHIFGSPL